MSVCSSVTLVLPNIYIQIQIVYLVRQSAMLVSVFGKAVSYVGKCICKAVSYVGKCIW